MTCILYTYLYVSNRNLKYHKSLLLANNLEIRCISQGAFSRSKFLKRYFNRPEKSFASDIKPLSGEIKSAFPRHNLRIASSRSKKLISTLPTRGSAKYLGEDELSSFTALYVAEREESYILRCIGITAQTSFPWIAANRTPSKLAALCAAAALSDFDIEINIPPAARASARYTGIR